MTTLFNKKISFPSMEKWVELEFRLRNYSFISIMLRFLFNFSIAFLILQLIVKGSGIEEAEAATTFYDYLIAFTALTVLNETLILIDSIFERFLPVPKKIKKRLFFQLVFSLILIVIIFHGTTIIVDDYRNLPKSMRYIGIASGFTTVGLFASSLLLTRTVHKWIQTQKQFDEMKKENLKMNYASLQDQLNPHFLFNNLSVLKSLIMFDEETALKFTDNFSDVYRYVLQSKNERLVVLDKELEFIQSYLGLHKERLGEGLKTEFIISDNERENEIAPLTMQLLVENAIKHNITSKEKPLSLKITAKNKELTIENNLQSKSSTYSTNTGLDNLRKRYKHLTTRDIEISRNDSTFKVIVPLL